MAKEKKKRSVAKLADLPLTSTLVYSTIGFLSVLCFINSLDGHFVFDDVEAIVNNKDVYGNVALEEIFHHDFWGSNISSNTSHKSYRPLTVLSFRLNHHFSEEPFGFHLTNIMLHMICCWMFYQILHELLTWSEGPQPLIHHHSLESPSPRSIVYLATTLFTVHPVHTECVAGIVGRAELLSAVFFLLAFSCYLRLIDDKSWLWAVPFPILVAVGFLCKEQAITVVGVCSAADVLHCVNFMEIKHRWRDKSFIKRQFFLTLVTLSLLYFRAAITNFQVPTFKPVENPQSFIENSVMRVLNYSYLWSLNAWILVAPVWLCFDWSMGCIPLIEDLSDVRLLGPVFLLVMTGYLVFTCCKRQFTSVSRMALLSVLMSVITFSPASHVFIRVGFVLAERVLYLPSMGYCMLVSLSWCCLYQRMKYWRKQVFLGLFILVTLMSARSVKRSYEWTNDVILYTSAQDVCPLNAKVHYNIAKVYADQDNIQPAFKHYHTAIELYPRYEQALNNLGNLYKDQGDLASAQQYLIQASQASGEFAAAWMNLGIVQAALNATDDAEKSYREALKHRKKYPDCFYNLGNLYKDMKLYPKALHAWNQATQQKPTHQAAWLNMLLLLDELNRYDDVLLVGREAIAHNPDSHTLHYNLASSMGRAERFDASEQHFLQAIHLLPSNPDYYTNLGVLYHRGGNLKQAQQMYNKALKLHPTHQQALANKQMLKAKV